MATPADCFREIHRLRRYIRELEQKTEQAPKQRKAQEDKVARQEAALKQAQDAIKQLKVHTHEKDVSIKTEQEVIRKYEKQLKEMITSKKEFDALTHEIAQAKATIGKLEDEALALIDQTEQRTAGLPELEGNLKKARDEFARFDKDYADNLSRYAQERERSLADLKAQEKSLPDDIRVPYERLTAAKGADALAHVHGGTCAACYTEVTPQMASDLRRGLYLLCKMCGRILYAE